MSKNLSTWEKLQSHFPENGNLAKLCYKMESSQPRKTYLTLDFKGCNYKLEAGEAEILGNALKKTDQTEALYLTHQVNIDSVDGLANYVKNSRALKVLDMSYSDILSLKPVIDALSPADNSSVFDASKGDMVGEVSLLNFSGIEMSEDAVDALSQKLCFNKSVLALKLASCNLNIDAIIKLLEGVNKNQTLEALDISRASRVNNPVNLSVHFQRYFANNNNTITTIVLNQLNLDDESIDNIVIGILRSENNLKNLNVASNKFSRDSSKSIVNLLSNNKNIEYLNLSYNRLENSGVCNILNCLEKKNRTLKTLIIKSCEASEQSWIAAMHAFAENKSLKEFFVWGNCFKNQEGAVALKRMMDSERFEMSHGIDLQSYIVDGVVLMAEDKDGASASEKRFHWTVDKQNIE